MGLIRALQAEGHQVVAIAPPDEYSERLSEAGCEYIELPMDQKGSNPLKDFKLMRKMKSVFREANLDIILFYTIKPNIYGSMAASSLGIPFINNVSGLGTVFIRRGITSYVAKRLYHRAFKKSKLVFFQNHDDKSEFLNAKLVSPSVIDVLPGSGVDLNRFSFHPIHEGKFTFLMVGRLIFDKGIIEFVEACKLLKAEGIDFKAGVAGFIEDDNYLGVPRGEVKKWEKEGIINYHGAVDNVLPLLQKSTCVVLPSYREGTPKSLLEAIATGRPIVTTDAPGCREVVVEGENGFLCEVRNAKDLAKKMKRMINLDQDQLSQMGHKSRAIAESKFDEQIVIQKYIQAIKKLV